MVCYVFFVRFHIAWNNRDHRKVVVIDGHTAYTGGLNLSDEYINKVERFGYWKDAGLKVTGDAVWNFTVMFLQVWNAIRKTDEGYGAFLPHKHYEDAFKGKGFIQPYADNPLDHEIVGENVYLNIINTANHYVYIYTPYLMAISNEEAKAYTLYQISAWYSPVGPYQRVKSFFLLQLMLPKDLPLSLSFQLHLSGWQLQ